MQTGPLLLDELELDEDPLDALELDEEPFDALELDEEPCDELEEEPPVWHVHRPKPVPAELHTWTPPGSPAGHPQEACAAGVQEVVTAPPLVLRDEQ